MYRTLAGGSLGTLEAPDRATAVRTLMGRGETPRSLELANGAAVLPAPNATQENAPVAPSLGWSSRRAGLSRPELAGLIGELAAALSAGLALIPALRTLSKQGRVGRQREVILGLIERVEAGRSLADAMSARPEAFNELTVNMTRAGEVSGRLEEVLRQAADLLDRDLKLRRSILIATVYPMLLLVLLTGAIVVIVSWIVPQILKNLQGSGIQLPWPTRVVQSSAHFLGATWWWLLPAIFVACFVAHRWHRTPEGRLLTDTFLMRVPVLGRVLRDVAVARFTRTLGTLVGAGLPILSALDVTKGTLGNRAMERVIDDVGAEIAAGKSIAEPLERSGYFPPLLVQVVGLGERSGKLDDMLMRASRAFEDRVDVSIRLFTALLPPALILVFAGIIGFVVLAVMLALLEVQSAAGG